MRAPSPSAKRRSARRLKPEERPVYAQRAILDVVTIEIPVPPSTNRLYANRSGGGRIKTTAFRAWRDNAVLTASLKRPARIDGICDVDIHLPPGRADGDNLVKPCLDAAVQIGVIADDSPKFIRHTKVWREDSETLVRMVFRSIPVADLDKADILTRAGEGQSVAYIAASLGLSDGQVRTVLAEASR